MDVDSPPVGALTRVQEELKVALNVWRQHEVKTNDQCKDYEKEIDALKEKLKGQEDLQMKLKEYEEEIFGLNEKLCEERKAEEKLEECHLEVKRLTEVSEAAKQKEERKIQILKKELGNRAEIIEQLKNDSIKENQGFDEQQLKEKNKIVECLYKRSRLFEEALEKSKQDHACALKKEKQKRKGLSRELKKLKNVGESKPEPTEVSTEVATLKMKLSECEVNVKKVMEEKWTWVQQKNKCADDLKILMADYKENKISLVETDAREKKLQRKVERQREYICDTEEELGRREERNMALQKKMKGMVDMYESMNAYTIKLKTKYKNLLLFQRRDDLLTENEKLRQRLDVIEEWFDEAWCGFRLEVLNFQRKLELKDETIERMKADMEGKEFQRVKPCFRETESGVFCLKAMEELSVKFTFKKRSRDYLESLKKLIIESSTLNGLMNRNSTEKESAEKSSGFDEGFNGKNAPLFPEQKGKVEPGRGVDVQCPMKEVEVFDKETAATPKKLARDTESIASNLKLKSIESEKGMNRMEKMSEANVKTDTEKPSTSLINKQVIASSEVKLNPTSSEKCVMKNRLTEISTRAPSSVDPILDSEACKQADTTDVTASNLVGQQLPALQNIGFGGITEMKTKPNIFGRKKLPPLRGLNTAAEFKSDKIDINKGLSPLKNSGLLNRIEEVKQAEAAGKEVLSVDDTVTRESGDMKAGVRFLFCRKTKNNRISNELCTTEANIINKDVNTKQECFEVTVKPALSRNSGKLRTKKSVQFNNIVDGQYFNEDSTSLEDAEEFVAALKLPKEKWQVPKVSILDNPNPEKKTHDVTRLVKVSAPRFPMSHIKNAGNNANEPKITAADIFGPTSKSVFNDDVQRENDDEMFDAGNLNDAMDFLLNM